MARFTATEHVIVDTLVRYSALHQEPSLAQIARECHVAKSTVVKTIQKLGFAGFKDFQYTYRLQSRVSRERLLPARTVEGDLSQEAERLAACFACYATCKNIVYAGGQNMERELARYVSRKLGMFDIFAPASYDYALTDHIRLDAGFALFFPREMRGALGNGDAIDPQALWRSQIAYYTQRGMHAILISDSPALIAALPAELRITLAPPQGGHADDLFAVRTLMLVEQTLALLGRRLGQSDDATAHQMGEVSP